MSPPAPRGPRNSNRNLGIHASHVILAVSGVGGALLAATFLQIAVASADSYTYVTDPYSTPVDTAAFGIPGVAQHVSETTEFDVYDVTGSPATPDTVGNFFAVASDATNIFGGSNQQILVEPSLVKFGEGPSAGSIFDTDNFGGGYSNVYTDLVGAGTGGTNLITDTLHTPYGNLTIPTDFDASAAATALTDPDPVTYTNPAGNSYQLVPDSGGDPLFKAASGITGFDEHVSETTEFDVDNSAGSPATPDTVGYFQAVVSDDTNIFGGSNQQILVQPSLYPSNVGPASGSIFDTDNFGGGYSNVYTDLVGAGTGGTNLITDTLHTPYGNVTIPTDFDASALATALTKLDLGPFADPAGEAAAATDASLASTSSLF